MQTLLIVLTVIVSVLLIVVVLIQKSKGGGLASNFSGANQIMGVRHTNNFIEKATWSLAIVILFLSILSSIVSPAQEGHKYNVGQQQQNTATNFNTDVKEDAAEAAAPAEETPATEAETPAEGE